jgi:group I intron endonuclease
VIVYCITNIVDGKQYVGATTLKLPHRWSLHKTAAQRHPKGLFHEALRVHGSEMFTIRELSTCLNKKTLDDLEKFWIRKLRTQSPAGYNMTGGGMAGFKVGPEISAKLSAAGMGRQPSAETREKLRKSSTGNRAFLGRKHSPETRAKMSASAMGNTRTLGFRHSKETRAKMSEIKRKRDQLAAR